MSSFALPTAENPVVVVTADCFVGSLLENPYGPHLSFRPKSGSKLALAEVYWMELRKDRSWQHWWHEFLRFAFLYEGRGFVGLAHRGWLGGEAQPLWDPQQTGRVNPDLKAAYDRIEIHWLDEARLYGPWGTAPSPLDPHTLRHLCESFVGLRSIDSTEAPPRLVNLVRFTHPYPSLFVIAEALRMVRLQAPKYNLIGVNCYAWARTIMLEVINRDVSIEEVKISDYSGLSNVEVLRARLWTDIWVYFMALGYQPDNHRISPILPVNTSSIQRLLLLFRSVLLGAQQSQYPAIYFRQKPFLVTHESTLDLETQKDCTSTGSPHTYVVAGVAHDLEGPSDGLSTAGSLLYLLTRPITWRNDHELHAINIWTWTKNHGGSSSGVITKASPALFECAITRTTVGDTVSTATLQVHGPRYELHDKPSTSRGEYRTLKVRLDRRHPMLRDLHMRDRIGVWAKATLPTEGTHVVGVLVAIETRRVSDELRYRDRLLNLLGPVKTFTRRDAIVVSRQAVRGKVGLYDAFDLSYYGNPIPSRTRAVGIQIPVSHLSRPGDFLYLLTAPIVWSRGHRPSSIKIETWSHDQGWSNLKHAYQGTYLDSWTWFEVGVLRQSQPDQGGQSELGICGERQTVCYNLHAVRKYSKHVLRMDHDQALVKTLVKGDRIGVWAKASFPGWENFVKAVKVHVYIGRGARSEKSGTFEFFSTSVPRSRPERTVQPATQQV